MDWLSRIACLRSARSHRRTCRLCSKNAQVNQAVAAPKSVTQQLFGDVTPMPEKYLAHLAKITDEIRVLHKWQPGDVLVYDNIIAQHGRQPWEEEQSDRVVLTSLFDGHRVPGALWLR
jgi:hypothetical protein